MRRATNGHEPKKIAEKSAGQKPAGKRTDWQALGRRGKGQIGNGTVTLTQAQLDAILETVGRLALDKDKLAATAGRIEGVAMKQLAEYHGQINNFKVLY